MATFGKVEIPDEEAETMSDGELVLRLVDQGTSRLTAERIVAVERQAAEPSRARRHSGRR